MRVSHIVDVGSSEIFQQKINAALDIISDGNCVVVDIKYCMVEDSEMPAVYSALIIYELK